MSLVSDVLFISTGMQNITRSLCNEFFQKVEKSIHTNVESQSLHSAAIRKCQINL